MDLLKNPNFVRSNYPRRKSNRAHVTPHANSTSVPTVYSVQCTVASRHLHNQTDCTLITISSRILNMQLPRLTRTNGTTSID